MAWDEVTAEAADNDILYVRVPVFDFDRIDQVRTFFPQRDGGNKHLSQERGGALVW